MSIYDNVAYGPRMHGTKGKVQLDALVEGSLKKAAIWDELKDRLDFCGAFIGRADAAFVYCLVLLAVELK